jgi:hypothetical protein
LLLFFVSTFTPNSENIMKRICLLLFLSFLMQHSLFSQKGYYSNKPINKETLRIALLGASWSRLPNDAEIGKAFADYKTRLGKHCQIDQSPFKAHLGYYKNDPLMDNKVLVSSKCTHSNGVVIEYVAQLKYDYTANTFRFENVLIQGQRDPSHPIHKERLVETAYFLRPLDLAPLQRGWISGGGGTTNNNNTKKPYPTPPPPPDDDAMDWVTVIVGGLTSALVIAIVNRMRKKKKAKEAQDAKDKKDGKKPEKDKKKEKEDEHYIIQFNKKALKISEDKSDNLIVTVYRVTLSAGQQPAHNATIILTASDTAITSSNSQSKSSLNTQIGLQGLAAAPTVFLNVTVTAGDKTYNASIPVQIEQENWHIDIVKLPDGKKGIRPGAKDGIFLYARASVKGLKTHPDADKYTELLDFKEESSWLDLGEKVFEKGWMKIYVEASNPDAVRNSISMPEEASVLVSLKVNNKLIQERVKISLLKAELDVDKDRLCFVAGSKKQQLTFRAFVNGASENEEWQFKAAYKADYGGDTKVLSDISMERLGPEQVAFTLTGPLIQPKKGEKEIRETLAIFAQVEDHEEPLERHVNVVIRQEGLYLEKGLDSNNEIVLVADGKIDKVLEFGLYVWDENLKDVVVPKTELSNLNFQLGSKEQTAVNVIDVLNLQTKFEDLVYNIPWGRYRFKSDQEIPGIGEIITAPFVAKATVNGKEFSVEFALSVKTYGIGPDFPEWQKAYENCIYTINYHVPDGDARKRLHDVLEKRKMTLGHEGLNEFRKQIWKIASNLILAEGEKGYKSLERWASAITYVLEWAEWMGNIAFNVLAAYYLKGYAPVASIAKGVMINAIICYREGGSAEDFFWKQLEQQLWGLCSAAEGRVIDVDKLEKWLGVNKAYAWLIFVSYHFVVNLYRTESVVEAIKQAAREARDEILVSWLLKKVQAEGETRGYKVPPKEVMATINKVKDAIKTDFAGNKYVDKKTVIEIMQDPQKVRTLKNHAPMDVQLAFERTRSGIQKAHDADLIAWISKTKGIPPQNIKIDDFRTPGAQGFSLNTDRDYRVVVRGGKGADGKDMWIELNTKDWANKSKEFFGKHSDKPTGMSDDDWARKCQQMPTDKYHIEASPDYSDQAIDTRTGRKITVEPNIMKVKAGKGKLIDPDALGNMYHEKVNASIRDNNIPESYAQAKKGVESLKKVRKGYQKQGLDVGEIPDNIKKGMEIVEKAPVDDTATPARLENINKQLQSHGFRDLNDFSQKMSGQFGSLKNAKPAKGFLDKMLGG